MKKSYILLLFITAILKAQPDTLWTKTFDYFDFGGDDNLSCNSSENISRLRALISKGIKIRPKAIVNTMYSRMFLSDLFIHGIGGATYDFITDEIIRGFFGVGPPADSVI